MLTRRSFFGLATAAAAGGASPAAATAGKPHRAVYHVSDEDKVEFALGNIRNHIRGVGGADQIDIVMVLHGPAVRALHLRYGTDLALSMARELYARGVQYNVCGNTLRGFHYDMADLMEGMLRIDAGGVVRIAQLQDAGYCYIRP